MSPLPVGEETFHHFPPAPLHSPSGSVVFVSWFLHPGSGRPTGWILKEDGPKSFGGWILEETGDFKVGLTRGDDIISNATVQNGRNQKTNCIISGISGKVLRVDAGFFAAFFQPYDNWTIHSVAFELFLIVLHFTLVMYGICNTAKRLVCWDLKKSCRAVLKRYKLESSLPGCSNEGLISVLWGGRKAGFYLRHQLPQLALKKSDWSALHVTKECFSNHLDLWNNTTLCASCESHTVSNYH